MPRQRKTKEPAGATLEGVVPVDLDGPVEDTSDASSTSPAASTEPVPEEATSPEHEATAEPADDAPDAPPPEALPALIEALLFVSDGPVEARTLARGLGVNSRAVARALDELGTRLEDRGLMLQSGPDGAQLVTVPEAAPYVQTFLGLEQNRRLSNAALEALAIIAYRQPVTRATIEAVRGVSSDGAIQTLRARGLIEEAGRSPAPGRPTLFVTTRRFLEHFGLQGPQDLPPLGDYELPPHDAPTPLPGLELDGATELSADIEQPASALEGEQSGPGEIEDIAEALASLSQAARDLADPTRSRPGATALLLPAAEPAEAPPAPESPEASTPPLEGASPAQG